MTNNKGLDGGEWNFVIRCQNQIQKNVTAVESWDDDCEQKYILHIMNHKILAQV